MSSNIRGRLFFGRVGEILGTTADGVPVTGSEEGVEVMTEVSEYLSKFRFGNDEENA